MIDFQSIFSENVSKLEEIIVLYTKAKGIGINTYILELAVHWWRSLTFVYRAFYFANA
jgi:hypothetical protein